LLKRIIDVRETNEVTITFPYIQTKSYLSTTKTMGRMTINVLDQLRAPTTVSSNVQIIVEIAGGPDFEVFNPQSIFLLPYIPTSTQSNWDPPGCKEESTVVGGAVINVSDDYARVCVGEKLISVRQFCKWWGWCKTDPAVAGSSSVSMSPFINPSCIADVSGTPAQGKNLADWISILSHGFAYSRGSVIISGYNGNATATGNNYLISLTPTVDTDNLDFLAYTLAGSYDYRGKPFNNWNYTHTGFYSFNCPAWSKTLSRATADLYEIANAQIRTFSTLPDYRVGITSDVSGVWVTHRSAGEDFTLGGFVGFGPFYVHP